MRVFDVTMQCQRPVNERRRSVLQRRGKFSRI